MQQRWIDLQPLQPKNCAVAADINTPKLAALRSRVFFHILDDEQGNETVRFHPAFIADPEERIRWSKATSQQLKDLVSKDPVLQAFVLKTQLRKLHSSIFLGLIHSI
jgi:hypothetical protein